MNQKEEEATKTRQDTNQKLTNRKNFPKQTNKRKMCKNKRNEYGNAKHKEQVKQREKRSKEEIIQQRKTKTKQINSYANKSKKKVI
jgi:hypothetical protein